MPIGSFMHSLEGYSKVTISKRHNGKKKFNKLVIFFIFSHELRCPYKTVYPAFDEKSYSRFAAFCPKQSTR